MIVSTARWRWRCLLGRITGSITFTKSMRETQSCPPRSVHGVGKNELQVVDEEIRRPILPAQAAPRDRQRHRLRRPLRHRHPIKLGHVLEGHILPAIMFQQRPLHGAAWQPACEQSQEQKKSGAHQSRRGYRTPPRWQAVSPAPPPHSADVKIAENPVSSPNSKGGSRKSAAGNVHLAALRSERVRACIGRACLRLPALSLTAVGVGRWRALRSAARWACWP